MFWGLDLTFHANSPECAPHFVLSLGGSDSLFSSQVPLGGGRGSTLHISIKRGGGGWGCGAERGQKGAKLHPSRPPLRPKRWFGRRTREAARKLCPFKGTLAARRGGKDTGSGLGLGAAGTAEQRRAQQSHSHYLQRSHPSPTRAPPPPSPPPKETSNPEHVPCPLSGEEVGRKRNESFLKINETFASREGGGGLEKGGDGGRGL